jgi:hypothetical protein
MDHDEEEAVMEIIQPSIVGKETDIAVENNKLKERIKMLEEHVCIMSTNRSSSNSSGPNQQIVDKLTDRQKDILTNWINS